MEALLNYFGEKLQYVCIYQSGQTKKKFTESFYGRYNTFLPTLKRMNEQGYSIFFTVNETPPGTNRKDKDVLRARAIWVDDDGEEKGGKTEDEKFPLPPSMIVETSPGKRQIYWFTSTSNLEEWQQIMNGLTPDLGGDAGAKLKVQVLRLPGFINTKTDYNSPLVTILGGNFKVYDWKRITDKFPKSKTQPIGEQVKRISDFSMEKSVSDIISGESIYDSCQRVVMSLANKGVTRNDIHAIANALLLNANADQKRITNAQIKLNSLVDNAMNRIATERVDKRYKSEDMGSLFTRLSWPVGKLGQISKEIYNTMPYPSMEIAIVSAFHMISALGGGCYHYQGTLMSRVRTILARPGSGKQSASDFFGNVLGAISLPNVRETIVTNPSHSPFNNHMDFNAGRCRSLITQEAGVLYTSTAGDKASNIAYRLKILGVGLTSEPVGITERSKGNIQNQLHKDQVKPVHAPVLCLLDESTPEVYLEAANRDRHVESGALSRSDVFFISTPDRFNDMHHTNMRNMNLDTIRLCEALVKQYFNSNTVEGIDPTVVNFFKEVDFSAVQDQVDQLNVDIIKDRFKAEEDALRHALVVRKPQRIYTTCMAMAIADSCVIDNDDPGTPKVTKEHWDYAVAYIEEVNRAILANATKGYMASHLDRAVAKLEHYLIRLRDGEDPDTDMLSEDGHVTQRWVTRKFRKNSTVMSNLAKMYYNDPRKARRVLIDQAIEDGLLSKVGNRKDLWRNNV